MLLAMARWRSARPSSALLRAAELTDSSTITCFVVKYFDGRSVALSVSYPCSSLLAIGYHSGGVRRGPTPQTGRLSGSELKRVELVETKRACRAKVPRFGKLSWPLRQAQYGARRARPAWDGSGGDVEVDGCFSSRRRNGAHRVQLLPGGEAQFVQSTARLPQFAQDAAGPFAQLDRNRAQVLRWLPRCRVARDNGVLDQLVVGSEVGFEFIEHLVPSLSNGACVRRHRAPVHWGRMARAARQAGRRLRASPAAAVRAARLPLAPATRRAAHWRR